MATCIPLSLECTNYDPVPLEELCSAPLRSRYVTAESHLIDSLKSARRETDDPQLTVKLIHRWVK